MGRQNITAGGNSTSFLQALFNNGVINSTTWSISPSGPESTGYLLIGGEDPNGSNSTTWTSTPVDTTNSTLADEWLASVAGISTQFSNSSDVIIAGEVAYTVGTDLKSANTTKFEFSTGYQYIGLPSSVWLQLCNAW